MKLGVYSKHFVVPHLTTFPLYYQNVANQEKKLHYDLDDFSTLLKFTENHVVYSSKIRFINEIVAK